MNGSKQVGFSQRVQLEWMERVASFLMAGADRNQIEQSMLKYLEDKVVVSGAVRGTREKMVTILLKTWVTVPSGLVPFRDDGLALLQSLPVRDHLPVHWGMTMVAYPFWGTMAESVGRLLGLQREFTAAQAQRRARETFGERETVARAARRILRCFVDWGVLNDGDLKGQYTPTPKVPITDSGLSGWIMEALLRSSGLRQQEMDVLAGSPALFPFVISLRPEMKFSPRLEMIAHHSGSRAMMLRD